MNIYTSSYVFRSVVDAVYRPEKTAKFNTACQDRMPLTKPTKTAAVQLKDMTPSWGRQIKSVPVKAVYLSHRPCELARPRRSLAQVWASVST